MTYPNLLIYNDLEFRDRLFVKDLLESELFGHAKGAFTGATTNKTGLIEKADKGTFFFNEIADATLIPRQNCWIS